MSMMKRIYIGINPKKNSSKSKIFYDDNLGILREQPAVVQVRYIASPTIVLRKNKRALKNKRNESIEHKAESKAVIG